MKTDRLLAAMRAAVCAVLFALLALPAARATDNNFPTPGGGTADGKVLMCVNSSGQAVPCGNSTTPVQIGGTFSATLSGFTPGGTFATITASATSGSVALPAGTVVAFQNTGSVTVSCTLGVGSATATANEIQVPASSTVFVTVGSNTFGACIDQTGSTSNTVVLAGGSGLGTGFGGGGGGGGSGGNVNLTEILGAAPSATNPLWMSPATGATFQVTGSASNASSGVATSSTNLPAVAYLYGWNGTTWDQLNKTANGLSVDGSGVVQPTSAAASAYADGSNVTMGTKADTAWTSGSGSLVAILKAIANNSAAAVPAGTNLIGFTSNDPCTQGTKLGAPINLTASGQLITGTASKKTYICSIDLVSATAQNVALVEGTGTTCATNIFGLAGGTTAATGWNLAANGGLTKGSGAGTVYSPSADTNATAANVCLLSSSTGQISGQITYVQQ